MGDVDVECGMQVLGGRSYMDYSSQNNNKHHYQPSEEAGPIVASLAKEGCDHIFIVVSALLAHIVAVIKLYVGR